MHKVGQYIHYQLFKLLMMRKFVKYLKLLTINYSNMNIFIGIEEDRSNLIKKGAKTKQWICPWGCPYGIWCKKPLKLNELACFLGLSERTIRQYKEKRMVPFLQAGPHKRIIFIPQDVIKAILNSPKSN